MTGADATQILTAMKNLAEYFRKTHVGGTIIYGVEIERKCLIDEINALHTAIKALESHAEVVRCKDCDHQEVCHLQARLEFCSDGERRAKE